MASGSRDVSSEEAGEVVYTIRCTHDGDTLPDAQASVNIFYANVASGALDWSLLLVLALTLGLVLASRIRQATRRVRT
jgi:hypothetical protein